MEACNFRRLANALLFGQERPMIGERNPHVLQIFQHVFLMKDRR
jgi:hypothetical protein